MSDRIRMLVACLWAGSLWTLGYIVAPTLFSILDARLAGNVAAALFRIEAWLSLACGMLVLGLTVGAERGRKRAVLIIAGLMVLCTLIGYFSLQPFMAELRAAAGPEGQLTGAARERFGLLHGIASVFYLSQSLLAIGLIWKLR